MLSSDRDSSRADRAITLFLCGDVMTGRGIDQVLPHPSEPRIYESYVKSALGYVELAEKRVGPLQRPVSLSYIWGDALAEWSRVAPDVRIINLETGVTTSEDRAPKGIHYRMHPDNVGCLRAAQVDCCVLANNHVLDWGAPGLVETLDTLRAARLTVAGAGTTLAEARRPARLDVAGKGRVIVFGYASTSSGVPRDWAARPDRPGVNLLRDLSSDTVAQIAADVRAVKQPGDMVVASIHWGGNWGYDIPREHRRFARALIDEAAVDLIHGHSSHHAVGIEVHAGKPILYGCGDFLNDYEGISGYEEYRDDLALMYFVTMDPAMATLIRLEMTPMQIRGLRLNRARPDDARWMRDALQREGARLGTRVALTEAGTLRLGWN